MFRQQPPASSKASSSSSHACVCVDAGCTKTQSKLAAKRGVAQPARAAMATNAKNIAQQLVTVQVPLAVATQLLNASKANKAQPKPKAVPISRAPVGRGGRVAKAVRAAPVARRGQQQQQPGARQGPARGAAARKPAPVVQVSYTVHAPGSLAHSPNPCL